MSPRERQPRCWTLAAMVWLAAVPIALSGRELMAAVNDDHPSEAWAPSKEWSPRVAELPTHLRIAHGEPSKNNATTPVTEVFKAAPLESDDKTSTIPCDGCPPHSSFMPSLGRYGLVAPAPLNGDVESVRAGEKGVLFGPPPCAGQRELSVPPCADQRVQPVSHCGQDFTPDGICEQPYNACDELGIYRDKHLNCTQRPLVELGMPLYLGGPVPSPSDRCGPTNPSLPRFYLYGDYRAAAAYIDNGRDSKGVLANRLNLEWDLWLTATERFHMSTGPLQRGNDFQRFEFSDGHSEFFNELDFFDGDTDTLYFEGDLGYMIGGSTGRYAPFDMPITAGLIPLVFQNGVWMNDAIVGAAVTIPARNSAWLDWSNFDITFFTGFDQVTSQAFDNDNSGSHVFGVTSMIDAYGGYVEIGYARLDDTANLGRSYNNVGVSYTRRYLNLVSNSLRAIVNSGQDGANDDRTAQGLLLIAENSFLSPWPYNVIPYVNTWAGFDNPQSVARSSAAGGALFNEGILFESDNLTRYPTLDATANETYGAAIGVDLLSPQFTHQLILEAAIVEVFGESNDRNAAGKEFGV